MTELVVSRTGAVAWRQWPRPGFSSPLIEPDSPTGFTARHTAVHLMAGVLGAGVRVPRRRRHRRPSCPAPGHWRPISQLTTYFFFDAKPAARALRPSS